MSRRAPIIVGAVALVLAALAVVFLVLPKMREVDETNEQLQIAQDQEIALEAELRALQEAQAQAPQTEAEIAQLEDQIPPTADLPALFRLLQGAADQSAVDFFSFTPGSPILDATASYSAIPSTITITGSYFAIDEYLFLLETLPRAAKVISIDVAPAASDVEGTTATPTGSLTLALSVEFYTTDLSAGPGSIPGPTEVVAPPPGTVTSPPPEPPAEPTPEPTEPGGP